MKQLLLSLVLLCCLKEAFAQKISLDTAAYKSWKRVGEPVFSYDGEWVIYQYAYVDFMLAEKEKPVKYLYNTKTGNTIPLTGRSDFRFLNKGKWLKYKVPANGPGGTDSTIFLCLKDGRKLYWNRPGYYNEDPLSLYLTYTYRVKEVNGASYTRLVRWNMETGDSVVLNRVGKYTSYNNQQSILYISEDNEKVLMAGSWEGKQKPVYQQEQQPIVNFALNKDGETGTILAASAPGRTNDPDLLIAFSLRTGKQQLILDFDEVPLPAGYQLGNRSYELQPGVKQILLDLVPVNTAVPVARKAPAADFDLELWTWNEPVSQRKQRRGMNTLNPSDYPKFIYHTDTKQLVQVSPAGTARLILPAVPAFSYAFLADSKPYQYSLDWRYDDSYDIYLVNVRTGMRQLIRKDCGSFPVWSPNDKYAVLYDAAKKAWLKIDPATAAVTNISQAIGFPVYDEEYDMPKEAPAYGIAGWTSDGKGVILYDRYDLWQVDLEGKKPAYAITGGYGRQNKTALRLLKSDFSENLNLAKEQLLRAFNETKKAKEIAVLVPGKGVKKLAGGDYNISVKAVSEDGKQCLFTKQSYSIPEDLWVSDAVFAKRVQVTRLNPQQQQYKWGSVQVVEWQNYNGKQNQGLLYLPENYNPAKKYPMIVDFYQTHSQDLNDYINPEYPTSTINIVTYVSNDYIVFRPDVHFDIGEPGESAYRAVISGTEEMIKRGIAQRGCIGLQGHSWSGYQVAYLVTRSKNLFACASPGAAVVNMTADYGGIRSNGAPRMFMYEIGQCRMGKSLWEDPQAYIRNSPIFGADKIETPLLIFHCDNDGAVSFSHGLSLFMAMRRLQKPAWLLNYKKENHTLESRGPQKDWDIRMRQFFDHYLNNKPMPRWMKEGINVDERGIDQKLLP
jgi:dipeptidyl aminopeptidase/acylaminoacyl peptidase